MLDRLETVTYPDNITTYTYDAAYNRDSETVTSVDGLTTIKNLDHIYNARNQLTDINDLLDADQNVTYRFDGNGNQTQKTQNTMTTDFVYDARDNLRQVTTGGSTVGQFLYDDRALRIEKLGDRGTERYTYDDLSVLTQSDASNSTLAKYDYGPNRLLSLNHVTEGLQFYLTDALNSVTNLTKVDGGIQARYQYDAFANARGQVGDSFNRFGFTGHERDTETGLMYFKARFYDPETGRFLSQDAFSGTQDNPPSLHRYLYAFQNPTVFVDLTGLSAEEIVNLQMELHRKGNKVGAAAVAVLAGFRQSLDESTFGAVTAAEESDSVSAAVTIIAGNASKAAVEAATEGATETIAKAACIRFGGSACRKLVDKIADVLTKQRGRRANNSKDTTTKESQDTARSGDNPPGTERTKTGKLRDEKNKRFVEDPNTSRQARDESSSSSQAVDPLADAREKGARGENNALAITGREKNTKRIASASGDKEFRVPDQMDEAQRHITEVKNVNEQGLTSQLLDNKEHVTRGGVPGRVDVMIDERTDISKNLLQEHLNPGSPIKVIVEKLDK